MPAHERESRYQQWEKAASKSLGWAVD